MNPATRYRRAAQSLRSATSSAVVGVFIRLAVGTAFLSSVADRFGVWGPLGTPGVSWGSFGPFVAYTGEVMPFLAAPLVEAAAWSSSVLELCLGVTLLLGLFTRASALLSGLLLLSFGVLLGLFVDPVKPFSFSVFSAAAAALALATLPHRAYRWSLDRRLGLGDTPAVGLNPEPGPFA